jgi:hypothetical protein
MPSRRFRSNPHVLLEPHRTTHYHFTRVHKLAAVRALVLRNSLLFALHTTTQQLSTIVMAELPTLDAFDISRLKVFVPIADIQSTFEQPVESCTGCIIKATNPSAYVGITPGPLFTFPCQHTQCRSCLTEHHFAKGQASFRSDITCAACDLPPGFAPYQNVPLSTEYVLEIGNLHDIHAPDYSTGNHFILDGQEARSIFTAVSRIHGQAAPGDPPFVLGITNQQVFNALDAHIASNGAFRLLMPMLLAAELQDIVLGDLVYNSLVRRPGAPHRSLAPYLNTGQNEDDWRRQALLVKVLRAKHADLEALVLRWEDVVIRWVAIVAKRWWARFE